MAAYSEVLTKPRPVGIKSTKLYITRFISQYFKASDLIDLKAALISSDSNVILKLP